MDQMCMSNRRRTALVVLLITTTVLISTKTHFWLERPSPRQEMDAFGFIADVVKQTITQMNISRVLVAVINGAYLPMAHNWLCNTMHMRIHKQVLIITTDKRACRSLEQYWKDIKIIYVPGIELNGNQDWNRVGYVRLTNLRAFIVYNILLLHKEVLQFEVDCVWLRNPLSELESYRGFDFAAGSPTKIPKDIAIGFVYLFPTKQTKQIWSHLSNSLYALEGRIRLLPYNKAMNMSDVDQIYLSRYCEKHNDTIKRKNLPLEKYADGKWYEMSKLKRKSSTPFIINNNWIIGSNQKMIRAKKYGHWFLDKNNMCNKEQTRKLIATGLYSI